MVYLELISISLMISFFISGVIVFLLKLFGKSTQDVRNFLAKFIGFSKAEILMILFPILLSVFLYFPVKSYMMYPSKKEVKQMVLSLYNNEVLLRKFKIKNVSQAVRNIDVIYIKKISSNEFKALVSYEFLNAKCFGELDIFVPKLGKYVFEFNKNSLHCNFNFLKGN